MRIAGKCPPEPGELEEAADRGFECVELYLETPHLDRYEESVAALEQSDVDVVSVHTPHVTVEEREYLERAAYLAERFDARLVMHSARIGLRQAIEIGETIPYDDIAYEASPGVSRHAIESIVLGQGKDLVVDVAHLYIASDEFVEDLAALLEHAAHLHLCDSTAIEDGLGFGEGKMDIERTIETVLESSFDGDTVLEVMPDHQEPAREVLEETMEGYDG